MVSSRSLMCLLRWCKRVEQPRDERVPVGGIGLLDSESAKHEGAGGEHGAEPREGVGRDRVGEAAVVLGSDDDLGEQRLTLPEARAEQGGEIVVAARRRERV